MADPTEQTRADHTDDAALFVLGLLSFVQEIHKILHRMRHQFL